MNFDLSKLILLRDLMLKQSSLFLGGIDVLLVDCLGIRLLKLLLWSLWIDMPFCHLA